MDTDFPLQQTSLTFIWFKLGTHSNGRKMRKNDYDSDVFRQLKENGNPFKIALSSNALVPRLEFSALEFLRYRNSTVVKNIFRCCQFRAHTTTEFLCVQSPKCKRTSNAFQQYFFSKLWKEENSITSIHKCIERHQCSWLNGAPTAMRKIYGQYAHTRYGYARASELRALQVQMRICHARKLDLLAQKFKIRWTCNWFILLAVLEQRFQF